MVLRGIAGRARDPPGERGRLAQRLQLRQRRRYINPVPQHSGAFLGSILYSYKLNWQTVLFAGYGDDRILTSQNDLVKQDRSIFFKVSYAIQR